ncbi:MAG TPA: choice-of-anchor Q domain-containing protein [Rudaea sp.]|nr:choice-of-anchor Q domain-containing protein [Rudaea sp.]
MTRSLPGVPRAHVLPLAVCLALGLHASAIAQRESAAHFRPSNVAPSATAGSVRVVKNCNDSGPDSLRDLLQQAQNGDTIDLSQLACSQISLTTGAIFTSLAPDLTVTGPGNHPFVIDAGNIDRALVHNGAGRMTIQDLTIKNGLLTTSAKGGGCIYGFGSISLVRSVLTSCRTNTTGSTPATGGAIRAAGDVTLQSSSVINSNVNAAGSHSAGAGIFASTVNLTKSVVSGNRATSNASYSVGGGIYATSQITVHDSTVSGNYAGEGGGMFSKGGATLFNSTVSGNYAVAAAGVEALANARIYNSTIARNTGDDDNFPAGLNVGSSVVTLQSSIVANNMIGAVEFDLGTAVASTVSGSNNLVMAHAAQTAVPIDTISADPKLGPLQNNGGPTQTHALAPNSPAIDKGNNLQALDFDQRGAPRLQLRQTDIGAFELVDAIFTSGFEL